MPNGAVGRGQERVDNLQALQGTRLALALAVLDDVAQDLGLPLHVEVLKALLDGFGAHGALEVQSVAVAQFAVQAFVALEVGDLEVLEAVPDLLEALDVGVGALAHLGHLACRRGRGPSSCPLPWRLRLRGAASSSSRSRAMAAMSESRCVNQLLALQVVLGLEVRQFGVAALFVDGGDHVGGEVDDLLEVLRRQVKQVAQARGNALEVPDVGYRSGELDVAHAFAANLGAGDFNATALADDALEAHALVLAAVALPVAGRTEDLFAEKTVLLRLEGAVVDGFRLLDLAVSPAADFVRSGQADAHEAE